jgi:hypothetical protein
MNNSVIDAIKTAEKIVKELLEMQPGEEVVLVADPETDSEMMQAISGVVQAVGAECTIAIMPSRPVEESYDQFYRKGTGSCRCVHRYDQSQWRSLLQSEHQCPEKGEKTTLSFNGPARSG